MPKIRINVSSMSGGTSVENKKTVRWAAREIQVPDGGGMYWERPRFHYETRYYPESSRGSVNNTKYSRFNYAKLIFSKPLLQYLPENTKLKNLIIGYTLFEDWGEFGKTTSKYITIAGKKFTFQTINAVDNSIKVLGEYLPDLSEIDNLDLNFDHKTLDDFLTKPVYAPGPVAAGISNPQYEGEMSNSYIYAIKTEESSTPPYIELEYDYNEPKSGYNLAPNGVVVNTRTPVRFSWNSLVEQKGFELKYRVDNGEWHSITKTTKDRFYDMPPGTIRESTGTVEWFVRVMEESGEYSELTSATFTIGTVPQPVPRLSSPVGDYIKNGKPITFEWDFVKNTVEEQKAYEIEVSLPNETKTIKGTSPNTSHTVDLKITDSIVVYWKMRVQNNFDDWSDWTDRVSFQTIGIPPAPQIMSIDNSNRPTVKWNSREQEAFKLSVEDMKGNVVFITKDILGATTREFKIDKVIPNGKYLFKLSILNAYAIYSEITEYTHIIEPTPIEKPTITIYKSNYFVEITSDYLEGEVLRGGKVIGKLKDGKFRDYTGANYKTYSYQVRAFKDDVVGVSDKKGCVTEFGEFNTLATVDKLEDFFLIKYGLNESIKKVYSFEVQGAAISLEGKKYPFYEFDNHARASFNLSFYLENIDQVIKLQSLVEKKKEFLLRENRGTNRQGTIQGVNVEYDVLGYLVTCTLIITGEDYE